MCSKLGDSGKFICASGVSFLSYIIESLKTGHQVDVTITGFKKAFDTVDHSFLILKLEHLSVGNSLLA